MSHGIDPVSPSITFDSYVIADTIRQDKPAAAAAAVAAPPPEPVARSGANPMVLAVGVIALLTFFLGVLVTLQFTGSRSAAVAAAAVTPRPVISTAMPAPSPSSLDQFVAASLEQDVTRQQTPDILTPGVSAGLAQPQVNDLEVAVLQGLTPARTVGNLTEAEKQQAIAKAQSIVSRNKLRMLREGVLAGVYTVEAENIDGNRRIVLKTINADLTSTTMANLLRQAASEGKIQIPASLNTADGNVDMDTLIFNLVQTSLANDGTKDGAEAARELSRRAFAASSAKTKEVKGERVYVVESGDSLAYISLQFYGRPSDFEKIYQANRSVLSSPDKIQIGQRLIIPG